MEHKCKKTDIKTVEKCELKRDEIISEIDTKIKYAKFINTDAVVLSQKAAQFCLEFAQFYEQKIKELTEENEAISERYAIQVVTAIELDKQVQRLTEENERLRAIPEQLHKEMSERMVEERKIERKLAVRKMHSEIKARCIKGGIYPAFVKSTIDQIAEEIIGEKNGT